MKEKWPNKKWKKNKVAVALNFTFIQLFHDVVLTFEHLMWYNTIIMNDNWGYVKNGYGWFQGAITHIAWKNQEEPHFGQGPPSCITPLMIRTWDNACEARIKHSSTVLASRSSPQTSSSTLGCRDVQLSPTLDFLDGGNESSWPLSCKELLRDPIL